MGIEWFRDLVICVFGILATISLVVMTALAFMWYRRAKPIMESIKKTTQSVENLSSCVEMEVARPLAQVASVIQGVRQAVGMVNRFTHRKDDDNE